MRKHFLGGLNTYLPIVCFQLMHIRPDISCEKTRFSKRKYITLLVFCKPIVDQDMVRLKTLQTSNVYDELQFHFDTVYPIQWLMPT